MLRHRERGRTCSSTHHPRICAFRTAAPGLGLFYGVFWWPWWLALVCFVVPWQGLYEQLAARTAAAHRSGEFAARGLRPVHAGVVGLVCVLMITELPARRVSAAAGAVNVVRDAIIRLDRGESLPVSMVARLAN